MMNKKRYNIIWICGYSFVSAVYVWRTKYVITTQIWVRGSFLNIFVYTYLLLGYLLLTYLIGLMHENKIILFFTQAKKHFFYYIF